MIKLSYLFDTKTIQKLFLNLKKFIKDFIENIYLYNLLHFKFHLVKPFEVQMNNFIKKSLVFNSGELLAIHTKV